LTDTKENGLNQEINFTLQLKRMQRLTSSARKFRLTFVSPEIFGAYVFARSAKFQQKAMFVEIG